MKLTPEQIIKRVDRKKSERGLLEHHWQELAEYTLPRKNIFTRKGVPGEKKGIELYDNTAMVSCDLLAAALHGMLTSPNMQWFQLATDREELNALDHVIVYLQDLTRRIHSIFNNSNFQPEIHEYYLDLIAFGTACMVVEEDEERVVRFSTKHMGEIFPGENAKGMIDEADRVFKWDARQIVEEFCKGVDTSKKEELEKIVGRDVAAAFVNGKNDKFELIHSVYREEITKVKSMPYLSQYILRADKRELREKRFRRFPYLISRWSKIAGEVYGRGPAMNALPEAKTCNMLSKIYIKGAQKVVDPPVQIPDDGFIRPLKAFAGGVNYYRAGTNDRAEPLFNDTRIDIGVEVLKERQLRIQQAFYIDRLNLAQNDRMTTVEVNQRIQEQLRFLGPMVGRQQPEFLQPLLARVLDIMILRDGGSGELLGEPPPEIQDVELDVHYSSPVARAQRVSEAQSLNAALAASAPIMTVSPDAQDVVNPEKVVREFWQLYGAPQKVLNSKREIDMIRTARAEAQQKVIEDQEQLKNAEVASKTAPLVQE